MMRSMYSGVSGLNIHQTKMDVIGNNIANVNTVGFKSSRVTFGEVFSQTIQGASSPNANLGGTNPKQIGLGASLGSIDVNMTEGASQRTDNNLDIQIKGSGFFVVSNAAGNYFTRAGAFNIDKAGNLVNSSGMKVMGWQADATTNEIKKGTVAPLKILDDATSFAEPEKTKNITFSGNINKNDEAIQTTGAGVPFNIQFFDSLGYQYTATLTLKATANPNEYAVTMAADSILNSEGKNPLDGGGAKTLKNTVIPNGAGNPALIKFDPATGKISTAAGTATSFSIEGLAGPDSTFENPIKVDFSTMTMYDGKTALKTVRGDSKGVGAGNKSGKISGYEVGGDGTILGKYTNGATKKLGQMVVANFANPAGLQKAGDNLFTTTANSGDFDGIGEDVTASGGNFTSGVLEMSNVNLSSEFTEMITTQRGFQANSRIITSSDELLQELVNLKR